MLIQLLKSFSEEEIKNFKEYLESPYLNKNTRALKFFNVLRKYYPGFESKKLEKEKIYIKLFPGKKYNEQIMKNMNSELLKLGKDFLTLNEYILKDGTLRSVNLLGPLNYKKLDTMFNKELKTLEPALKDTKLMEDPMFYNLYKLEIYKMYHGLVHDQSKDVIMKNIEKTGEYFIYYFLINFSKICIDLWNETKVRNLDDTTFVDIFLKNVNLEGIMKFLKDNNYEFYPLIAIYYNRLKAFQDYENDEYFYQFKNLFIENFDKLNRVEKYLLLQSLENTCIIKINKGNSTAWRDLFELYDFEIKQSIYKARDEESITPLKFRNMVLTSLIAKQFDWVEKFIETYKMEILKEVRDNIVNISYAHLFLYKGEHEKSLNYLNQVTGGGYVYKIDIKNLTLMNYYELGYYDSVSSVIDSYRHVLANDNSIPPIHKESSSNFISACSKLVKLKSHPTSENKEKLLAYVNDTKLLKQKEWLIEKVMAVP